MSATAVLETLKQDTTTAKPKRGRPSKNTQGETKVTATTEKLKIQRTVFDLQKFDDVKLLKYVNAPAKPENMQEALNMVEGKTEKLLDLIHKGLIEETRDRAADDITDFKIFEDDKEEKDFETYTGNYADEEKGKLINAAVLSLAKMQGYEKSLTPDQKRALKDKAKEFLRANPAMLASIQK